MRTRVLGALVAMSVAGCAPAGQVRASEPHGEVQVRIEHGNDDDYTDMVYLDGLGYGLVTGRPLLLRLSPGKHELELVSTRTELGLGLVPSEEFNYCTVPTCTVPGNQPSRRMELRHAPGQSCARTLVVDVKAGENIDATLVATPDGICATRG